MVSPPRQAFGCPNSISACRKCQQSGMVGIIVFTDSASEQPATRFSGLALENESTKAGSDFKANCLNF